ncbi:Ctr-domain-containing protein [Karstenula rhodostoma CBS 690.94]|uniref:Copper transport protein n=1 Tax=Karstenula rhodostoma CBS 690.94 TaxID=1392251 RepID=A0A9P4UE41_9PLEO|nr:Ctr-domain-containing protein [Karstenula rhodostoma CBS 690.94]
MSHSMDMAMSGMDMGTATSTSAMPSSTAGMAMGGMGGMDMGGGDGKACKISMLWNWDTVGTCFLSKSWHNTSKGMFAGSCIGVILLVLSLEFLRRAAKEYDRYILAQHTRSLAEASPGPNSSSDAVNKNVARAATRTITPRSFRPSLLQQVIRALLHMLQFAVAYFVMLLAMYYNGYIIICIFIGAFLGYFVFGWESFNVSQDGKDRMQEEVTVCCG